MEQEIRRQHIFQDEFSGRESGGHGDRIIRYVEEHFAERITLTDLSEKYELSCTYLNAKFKAETGYTFLDFLNRYRISQAVKLLKKTGVPDIRNCRNGRFFPTINILSKCLKSMPAVLLISFSNHTVERNVKLRNRIERLFRLNICPALARMVDRKKWVFAGGF